MLSASELDSYVNMFEEADIEYNSKGRYILLGLGYLEKDISYMIFDIGNKIVIPISLNDFSNLLLENSIVNVRHKEGRGYLVGCSRNNLFLYKAVIVNSNINIVDANYNRAYFIYRKLVDENGNPVAYDIVSTTGSAGRVSIDKALKLLSAQYIINGYLRSGTISARKGKFLTYINKKSCTKDKVRIIKPQLNVDMSKFKLMSSDDVFFDIETIYPALHKYFYLRSKLVISSVELDKLKGAINASEIDENSIYRVIVGYQYNNAIKLWGYLDKAGRYKVANIEGLNSIKSDIYSFDKDVNNPKFIIKIGMKEAE